MQNRQPSSRVVICPFVETKDLTVGNDYQLALVDQSLNFCTSKAARWGHGSRMKERMGRLHSEPVVALLDGDISSSEKAWRQRPHVRHNTSLH